MDAVALHTPEALRELSVADAPFAGTLRAGDPPTVWVDAAAFGASPAWAAAGAEHLLTAIDAAGTSAGACVIVPHCPTRLVDLVLRGGASSRGAIVTVAISALRGAAEADALGAKSGQWWVTTSGRPVLALTGGLDWRADAAALLNSFAADADDAMAEILRRTAATVADARLLGREGEAIEAELFAVADAAPLPLDPAPSGAAGPTLRSRPSPPPFTSSVGQLLHDGTSRFVDGAIADRLRGIAASLAAGRSRSRPVRRADAASPRPRRRRVGLVAVGAAAVVLGGGALWPGADDPSAPSAPIARAEPRAGDAVPRPTPVPSTASSPATASTTPDLDDALANGRALVAEMSRCGAPECVAALWESPAHAQRISAVGGDVDVELVDEYGGVAALRVIGGDETQIVVIVRTEQQWLVREVYDLADQP